MGRVRAFREPAAGRPADHGGSSGTPSGGSPRLRPGGVVDTDLQLPPGEETVAVGDALAGEVVGEGEGGRLVVEGVESDVGGEEVERRGWDGLGWPVHVIETASAASDHDVTSRSSGCDFTEAIVKVLLGLHDLPFWPRGHV